jgi:hypothetical protein
VLDGDGPASFTHLAASATFLVAMKVSRNDPCPCGSGKKYKRCHMEADQAEAASRSAEAELLASEGRSDEALGDAQEAGVAPEPGDGPIQRMMEYVEPLLDGTAQEREVKRALQLGMMFQNLALLPLAGREAALAKFAEETGADAEVRAGFRQIAEMMIARHEAMFPELHERRGESE